jgi:hypothetical protein
MRRATQRATTLFEGGKPLATLAAVLRSTRILAALAAAALAVGVAACGDDKPERSIPADSAQELANTLGAILSSVDNGDCTTAAGDVQELQEQIEALPSEVNDEVADALQDGALNLGGLVDDECEEPEVTTTEETTTEEPETTETEQTTTEETTTEPPTTTLPPPTTPGDGGVGPGQGGL